MQDGDYGRVSEVKIEKDLISKTACVRCFRPKSQDG